MGCAADAIASIVVTATDAIATEMVTTADTTSRRQHSGTRKRDSTRRAAKQRKSNGRCQMRKRRKCRQELQRETLCLMLLWPIWLLECS